MANPGRRVKRGAREREADWARSAASDAEVAARLEAVRAVLGRRGADALLVSGVANVRYLSGFTGDSSWALVTARRAELVTDFRYFEEAAASAPLFRVAPRRRTLLSAAVGRLKRLRSRCILFESQHMTAKDAVELGWSLGGRVLKPAGPLLERMRQVKSPGEVARLRGAVRAAERAFRWLRRRRFAGRTEREVAADLVRRLVREGADGPAFPVIALANARASLPHGRASIARFHAGGTALFDFGARVGGYHSDLTRSFALDRIPGKYRRIHDLVRRAQRAALAAVRPGARLADVDRAAREVIVRGGYGGAFGHSTGHGVGLEVHELPVVGPRARGRLKPGMVFTVEPGVYLPGEFGVRIEDDVLVTEDGCEVLSRLPRGC